MKKTLPFYWTIVCNSCIFSKNKKIEIPFTMDRNLIIIEAKIDKKTTQNFIFDTGAEGIMLMDSVANLYKFKSNGLDTIVNQKESL